MTNESISPSGDRPETLTIGGASVLDHPGAEPAVILLHGFPDDSTIYDRLVPYLAGRRTVAVDFPGYGRSPRDTEPYRLGARSREVLQILDALHVRTATIVGHDASLSVAVDVALTSPDRVRKLVLLNGYYQSLAGLRFPDMIELFATPRLQTLADALMDDPQQRAWLLGQAGGQFGIDASAPDNVAVHSILPQYFGGAEHPDARRAIREWAATLYDELRVNDEHVAAGRIAQLAIPVVVAFGAKDPYLTPEVAQAIGALFADAVVERLENSSHWPQWDEPEAIASSILRD